MATFDPIEQRMCVRVVYDGVANAGKTTNLRQLASLFAAGRTTEVCSPGELDGRTLYFDWLEIVAGVVCGFPLTCQIISVPGQIVLTPRRRHLLESADVVVYVCDSSARALDRTRAGLSILDEVRAGRPGGLPIVVQANKQDQPDAIDRETLLAEIGRQGTTSVEAIAMEGIGVIDTFVAAVRTVSRAMRDRSEAAGLRVEVRRAARAGEVFARLADQAVDPEWAAELLLEHAQSALAMDTMLETAARPAPPRTHAFAPPALPTAEVPTGFVWPAHTGRAVLRALSERPETRRPLVFEERRVAHVVDGRLFHTSVDLRFEDREQARQALVRGARARTQLEGLLVPETVLVVQPSPDGAWWIWSIEPQLPSFASALAGATEETARDLVAQYAGAVVDLVKACLRHGLFAALDVGAFGLQGGKVRFVGELGHHAPDDATLARALRGAIGALGRHDIDAVAFCDAFARGAHKSLGPDEVVRLVAALPVEDDDAASSLRRILNRAADAA